MIFKDILTEKTQVVAPELRRLIINASENQKHPGDLLLLYVNGFFQDSILTSNKINKENFNPHVIGPGYEGHSEVAHYNFINKYRTNFISKLSHEEYIKQFNWSPEKKEEIAFLTDQEETTIQLEMLIYLKFWEADLIIKKLYQFTRLLNSEPYDWYFKVAESSRDKECTGTRQDIIRKQIRDKLKKISPILYNLIKNTYFTQLRNSIAHSNYSFLGRNIHLNNYIKDDPAAQLQSLTFDEWIEIFHNTMILYNEYIGLNNLICEKYAEFAKKNGMEVEVLVNEKDGSQYPLHLEYRPKWNDWRYKQKT